MTQTENKGKEIEPIDAYAGIEASPDLRACMAQEVVFIMRELSSIGTKTSNMPLRHQRLRLLHSLLNTVSPLLSDKELVDYENDLNRIEKNIKEIDYYIAWAHCRHVDMPESVNGKLDRMEWALRKFISKHFSEAKQ